MRKVLHITARADMGGGPRHIQYLLDVINNEYNCFIACPVEEPFREIFQSIVGASKIVDIPHRRFDYRSFKKLHLFLKKNKIDIVHCHGKGAATYGKALKFFNRKLKLVYTPHGIHVSEYNKLGRVGYQFYEYLTSPLFDHVIYVSESEQQKAVQAKLFKTRKSTVIPNGVPFADPGNVDIDTLKDALFANDNPIILTFSRFNYQKNMSEAFAIAEALPGFNFLWIGDGQDYQFLKKASEQKKLTNIRFTGALNEIQPYLFVCDLYLSTSRWEGMPLSLLEAMSAGLPIVASNVTGNKDVIFEGKNGLLYELGNVVDAVKKIKECLGHNVHRSDIIDVFSEGFSSKMMGNKVSNVYKNII